MAEKLKELIDNIKDREAQFDSLTEAKRETSEKLAELKTEIEALKKKIALKKEHVLDKENELNSIDNNLRDVTIQLQKSVAQLPKAKETKERIDQYWKGNGVEVKEDADLDYLPHYSEEQLGKVIAEIEGLDKEEQLKEEPDDKPEETKTIDDIEDAVKAEEISLNVENPAETYKQESDMQEDISGPQKEITTSNYEKNSRQIADKHVETDEDTDSKSQKNGFFGGLFGRKK